MSGYPGQPYARDCLGYQQKVESRGKTECCQISWSHSGSTEPIQPPAAPSRPLERVQGPYISLSLLWYFGNDEESTHGQHISWPWELCRPPGLETGLIFTHALLMPTVCPQYDSQSQDKRNSCEIQSCHRIIKWFGLEGTLKIISFQPPCHGQGRFHWNRFLKAHVSSVRVVKPWNRSLRAGKESPSLETDLTWTWPRATWSCWPCFDQVGWSRDTGDPFHPKGSHLAFSI